MQKIAKVAGPMPTGGGAPNRESFRGRRPAARTGKGIYAEPAAK